MGPATFFLGSMLFDPLCRGKGCAYSICLNSPDSQLALLL
jgi:hypothetical protein